MFQKKVLEKLSGIKKKRTWLAWQLGCGEYWLTRVLYTPARSKGLAVRICVLLDLDVKKTLGADFVIDNEKRD